MSTKKVKPALANMLDRMNEITTVQGGEVKPNKELFALNKIDNYVSEPLTSSQEQIENNSVIYIEPNLCTPWKYADRSEVEMGDLNELANSILQSGQQEPILVRPILNNSNNVKYEIIFGNRRWRACLLLKRSVFAIVKNLNDQEAAYAQKEENENRADISDYSRAFSYKRLINEGVFANENQLCIQLNIPRNRLNDLMAFTRIPESLRNEIPNIHLLSQRMAIKISSLAKDEKVLPLLFDLANDIGTKKITSTNIDKKIQSYLSGIATKGKRTPITSNGGAEIFTIREDSNGAPCIVFHKAARKVLNIDDLEKLIKGYIEECLINNI